MRPWCYFCLKVDDNLPYCEKTGLHVCSNNECQEKYKIARNIDMSNIE